MNKLLFVLPATIKELGNLTANIEYHSKLFAENGLNYSFLLFYKQSMYCVKLNFLIRCLILMLFLFKVKNIPCRYPEIKVYIILKIMMSLHMLLFWIVEYYGKNQWL